MRDPDERAIRHHAPIAAESEIRAATDTDAARLLVWRNEPATRAASRQTDPIGEGEHRRWLTAVLADPDRHLLVAELNGEPVGQLRFDRVRGYRFEISVSVASEWRGAGLGAELIRTGCDWLWRAANATEVEAWVRSENDASRQAFAAAGFEPAEGARPGFMRMLLPVPEDWAHPLRGAPPLSD